MFLLVSEWFVKGFVSDLRLQEKTSTEVDI